MKTLQQIAIASTLLLFSGAFSIIADDTSCSVDSLLAQYKAHGLPLPPKDAILVRRKLKAGVMNGVQRYQHELAFVVMVKEKKVYWEGCEPQTRGQSSIDETVAPAPDVLKTVTSAELYSIGNKFPTFPDLALAIQCDARGWHELAVALLERSNRRVPSTVFDRSPPRPENPQNALATLAWNYWCNRFADARENRPDIFAHLKKLSDGSYDLDTEAHTNILSDMEETLVESSATRGTPEAAIDALIELNIRGYWPGSGYEHWCQNPGENADFQKLRDMGLEAVPILLKHLHDYRLTRSIQTSQGDAYTWHVRIADAVAVLLNGLYDEKEEFAHDFLSSRGRGMSLDERHVLHWWGKLKGRDALNYLLENAITKDVQQNLKPNASILSALGSRHPEELVALVGEHIAKIDYIHELLDALAKSKATKDAKVRLFLSAAEQPEWCKRTVGIAHLLDVKHPSAVPLLIKEIEGIPETPDVAYWVSSAAPIARLVRRTNNEKAWEALLTASRRVDVGQRMEMVQAIGRGCGPSNPKRLTFLKALLVDKESRVKGKGGSIPSSSAPSWSRDKDRTIDRFSGPCAGFTFGPLTVGDYAAFQTARLLNLEVNADASWSMANWAELRKKVNMALEAKKKIEGKK
jgi:hypothetical protein